MKMNDWVFIGTILTVYVIGVLLAIFGDSDD
jgi:uncharacterized membrane protein YczE